jgi:hypothetical protein
LSKKYLLKKLWGSYDVISEYQLVNNDQLPWKISHLLLL